MQAPVCRDCLTGTIRSNAAPSGSEQTVHGLPTYVTGPGPDVMPLGTVVIIPDAFGWKLPNTRVLADAYARRVPCTVYVPDFMNGYAIPESVMPILEAAQPQPTESKLLFKLKRAWSFLTILPVLLRFLVRNRAAAAHPRVLSFFRALRAASGRGKIAAAGFCWGGLHAVRLTHDVPDSNGVDPLVDCAFTAHPSLLTIPGDIEAVVRPLSVANGDDDEYMGREKMRRVVAILEGKNRAAGREVHETAVYPGAKHGFGVRANPADPVQREAAERSEEQAVRWFRRHFEEEGR
ncbi:hypothetical protein VTK56DRAFT_2069 [Thermocarpiscus australiensis]